MTHDKKHVVARLLMVVWLLVVIVGFWGFSSQAFAPSSVGHPPATWPRGTTVQPSVDGFTLVVAIHPECPCSSATLDELRQITTQTRGRLEAYALYAMYPDPPHPVEQSSNWRRAADIPEISRVLDEHGELSSRFAALSSGEVCLYGPDGNLRFHGGITASRGHAGPNPGALAVLDIVLDRCGAPAPLSTPVFGCPL